MVKKKLTAKLYILYVFMYLKQGLVKNDWKQICSWMLFSKLSPKNISNADVIRKENKTKLKSPF